MEPGEGSAAPKATVALPGTDVNLAGRAPARLAVHCILATGGPGAATPHAPFGRPRLAFAKRKPSRFATYVFAFGEYVACGALWVLSRVGKYLVRPQADETSHKKQISCGWQGKALPCFSCNTEGFASAEATKGLSIALWKPSAPYLLKLFQAKKPKVFSSFISMKKRVFSVSCTTGLAGGFLFAKKALPTPFRTRSAFFLQATISPGSGQ